MLCCSSLLSTGTVDSFHLRPVERAPPPSPLQPSERRRRADDARLAFTDRRRDGHAPRASSDPDAASSGEEGDDGRASSDATGRDDAPPSSSSSYSHSFDTPTHRRNALLKCLLVVAGYMAVGALAFSRVFERWPIVDSLYFSVVTFTTVG